MSSYLISVIRYYFIEKHCFRYKKKKKSKPCFVMLIVASVTAALTRTAIRMVKSEYCFNHRSVGSNHVYVKRM